MALTALLFTDSKSVKQLRTYDHSNMVPQDTSQVNITSKTKVQTAAFLLPPLQTLWIAWSFQMHTLKYPIMPTVLGLRENT